jgi:hypothetical protein
MFAKTGKEMNSHSIRIISTPPGDAPLWVREKWVGLELPIVGEGCIQSLSFSVLIKSSLLRDLWTIISGRSEKVLGYQVEAKRAVVILAASSPDAAEWWEKNTPSLLRSGRLFVFHAEACLLNKASAPI